MKFSDIKRSHITVGGILAALAILPGLYAGAATLGYRLDRPAWYSELERVAGSVERLQEQADKREEYRLQERIDALFLKIERDKAAGRQPNPEDMLELRQKQRQIEQLQELMKPEQ